jgi:hypothetical protein
LHSLRRAACIFAARSLLGSKIAAGTVRIISYQSDLRLFQPGEVNVI